MLMLSVPLEQALRAAPEEGHPPGTAAGDAESWA
jgi:hypothetical protein